MQGVHAHSDACMHTYRHNTRILMHNPTNAFFRVVLGNNKWFIYLPVEFHQCWLYFLKKNSNLESFKIISWVAKEVTDEKNPKESIVSFLKISFIAHMPDFRHV